MVMLVKVDAVKKRLKYPLGSTHEDDDLKLAIQGASEAVLNYMNLDHDYYTDSSGTAVDPPATLKNAVIMLVGIWKQDPSGKNMTDWAQGYLPAPVTALLYPLRTPNIG